MTQQRVKSLVRIGYTPRFVEQEIERAKQAKKYYLDNTTLKLAARWGIDATEAKVEWV